MGENVIRFIKVLVLVLVIPATGAFASTNDKRAISVQNAKFSSAYVERDVARIMECFEEEARIAPVRGGLIKGFDSIKQFWTTAVGGTAKLVSLEFESDEIIIMDDVATDIGYYKGVSRQRDGKESAFMGAYVTVWKKREDVWRMQHSMWRALKNPQNK